MRHKKKEAQPEVSYEQQARERYRIIYSRQLREKQIFLQELDHYREEQIKRVYRQIKKSVGPKWYHELSDPQRMALDKLECAMYQDILEDRPHRTASIMRELGLYPRPSRGDLMTCLYICRNDPKEMLAQYYYMHYGYPIDIKCSKYNLNAKLLLSAILYLGLDNLIERLEIKFSPDLEVAETPPKPKPKPEPPLASPYLQKMEAVLWTKPVQRRAPPAPLPSLEDINEPYEDTSIAQAAPPTKPKPTGQQPQQQPQQQSQQQTPAIPKKRIPREACDAMAGILRIEPHEPSETVVSTRKPVRAAHRKLRSSKSGVEGHKVFGMAGSAKPKNVRPKKPVAPSTGLQSLQYAINGVFTINGKSMYVLGNVISLPTEGELIHGGYAVVEHNPIPVHCGYRGQKPPPPPDPCDCLKKWQETVFTYMDNTKCYCGHRYDYGHTKKFPEENLPFFEKPTEHTPLQFNYETIYNVDERSLHVTKEFKLLYDTESLLRRDDDSVTEVDTSKIKKKSHDKNLPEDDKKWKQSGGQGASARQDKTSVVKKQQGQQSIYRPPNPNKTSSKESCLGRYPTPKIYLKCALRFMRSVNLAARLPELHLVPQLVEWMRIRMFGPLTTKDKKILIDKSCLYWALLGRLATRGFGHVYPPKDKRFEGHTNWLHKKELTEAFRGYAHKYRLSVYRSHANITNIFWRTMFQAEVPDKKFREIFFSYLFATLDNIQLLQPFNSKAVMERRNIIMNKRVVCLPAGAENLNI